MSVDIDGVLYLQVVNPEKSAYGISDYMFGSVQLAQTALRSAIGKLELDRTFEERSTINQEVISALDAATAPWGIKVLRYEIRDITPPSGVMQAMEKQMRAEREKRALIAQSEGEMQARINMAEGAKAAAIAESEGKLQAMKNQAEGDAVLIRAVAQATADGLATGRRPDGKAGRVRRRRTCALRKLSGTVRQARQGGQHYDPAHGSGEHFRPRQQPHFGDQASQGVRKKSRTGRLRPPFCCLHGGRRVGAGEASRGSPGLHGGAVSLERRYCFDYSPLY